MKLDKTKYSDEWHKGNDWYSYSLTQDGDITLEDSWNAVGFLCRIGKVRSIGAIELHDVSDASVAGVMFGTLKEFTDWAEKQEDRLESEGGYELDHAEVITDVGGERVELNVAPRPLWTRNPVREKLIISFDTKDERIGDMIAETIKKHYGEEGA